MLYSAVSGAYLVVLFSLEALHNVEQRQSVFMGQRFEGVGVGNTQRRLDTPYVTINVQANLCRILCLQLTNTTQCRGGTESFLSPTTYVVSRSAAYAANEVMSARLPPQPSTCGKGID